MPLIPTQRKRVLACLAIQPVGWVSLTASQVAESPERRDFQETVRWSILLEFRAQYSDNLKFKRWLADTYSA